MYNQVLKSTIFSPSHNTIIYSNSVLFHLGKNLSELLECIISNTTENIAKLLLQITSYYGTPIIIKLYVQLWLNNYSCITCVDIISIRMIDE